MPAPPPLPPDAEQALAGYEPLLAAPEHAWLIVELVAWYGPSGFRDARVVAGAVSGLLHWAEQTGRPVRADQLLTGPVIDSYISHQGLAATTRRTQRSMLMRVMRRRASGHSTSRRPARAAEAPPTAAYAAHEIDGLLLWAANQPNPLRRHSCLALLILGLGAGLAADDMRAVRGTGVVHDDQLDTVLVKIAGERARTVPLLRRYHSDALALAEAAGDGWYVNPGLEPRETRTDAVAAQFGRRRAWPSGLPAPSISRARTTWLTHHLERGVRFDVLAHKAGYRDPTHLAKIATTALRPLAEDEALNMLTH